MPEDSPGSPYRAVNPATGELVATFPTATDAQVAKAVAGGHAAFLAWRDRPLAERAATVGRVGELFARRTAELAELAATEMGKPLPEAIGEAEFCKDIFAYYAEQGPTLAADEPLASRSATRAVIQKRPLGLLLGIMPWNYPFYQVARFAAPNLVIGNAMLLKHAESVPQCALAVEALMREAGVPDGVYQNLFASHGQIETIIADPRVQGVSLTGSERAGSIVAATAGRHLTKCVLELGGSDPYIVLDSPDVAKAAEAAWARRMSNTGQACNSNKRMIVTNDLYEPFVQRLVELASSMSPVDPRHWVEGSYTPMASRAAAEQLAAQVDDAVANGATLHVGGSLGDAPTAYFAPAVLTGVTPGMRAYREELFGPVAVVYRVSTDDEAVALANDTDYGLGAAVFSADPDRASKVAERLDVGMSNVNIAAGGGAHVPFGGVKRSGFGRELGPLGMDEFANKRLFWIA